MTFSQEKTKFVSDELELPRKRFEIQLLKKSTGETFQPSSLAAFLKNSDFPGKTRVKTALETTSVKE